MFKMQRSYSDVMIQTRRDCTTPPKMEWSQRFTSFRQNPLGGMSTRDQVKNRNIFAVSILFGEENFQDYYPGFVSD
jgi:hypothetical protein